MTTPYYSDESVTLWHGDCLEITDWLQADVLLTDPPYGINYLSGSRRATLAKSILNDKDTSHRDQALEMWRDQHDDSTDSRMNRPALMFGSWKRPKPADTRALLIWDTKGALGMGDLSIPWKPSHQEVYVLGAGFTGHRDSDVLTYPPVQSMATNGRHHPHEKPLPLLTALLRKCPEGVVADPFAGSGSTLLAARLLGRRAIGVEIEERYCEVIAKRLSQGVLL